MLILALAVQAAPPVQQAPTAVPARDPARPDSPNASPSNVGPAPTADDQPHSVAEVVVVAERPAVLNQIDRRIYDIGKDPAAQTSPAIELLEKIPSVTVDPSGRLRLLGQSGVTLLIDGQKPANDQAILRTLTGSTIDRIEVMTNPGVQYGPTGTGGIINIITRRRTRAGVSGTVAATIDTFGATRLTLSPSVASGRWTTSGTLGLSSQDDDERSRLIRDVFAMPGLVAARTEEARVGGSEDRSATATVKVDYRIDDDRRLSGGVETYGSVQDFDRQSRVVSADIPVDDRLERNEGTSRYSSVTVNASYGRTGPREGEELTLAAQADDARYRSRTDLSSAYDVARLSDALFRTTDRSGYDNQSLKLDYRRPVGDGRIMTAGASWERNGQSLVNGLDVMRGPFVPLGPTSRRIDSARNISAAYATIQVDWAGLTLLPGLRLEYQDLDIASAGAAGAAGAAGGNSGLDLYPSLHLSRPLGEGLKLNLSYAKRINRPDAWILDPSLIYGRQMEASRGNPGLRPQTIESFEARLDYTRPRYSLSATAYDKESHDLWTSFGQRFDDGLIVTTIVNAGRAADRGVELSGRGKLGERFSYVVTTNLFASTRRVLEGDRGDDRTAFVYSGSGQLEYAAPARQGMEADKVQLSANYTGPQRGLQTESEGAVSASLTWRHPLTKKTTAVLTVRNLFNNASGPWRTTTDAFTQATRYDNRGVQIRFGLTYRLGETQ